MMRAAEYSDFDDTLEAGSASFGVDVVYMRKMKAKAARAYQFSLPEAVSDKMNLFVAFSTEGEPLFASASKEALKLEAKRNDLRLVAVH